MLLIASVPLGIEVYGKKDPARGIGAGFRLRDEIRRQFAPYVGLVWARRQFETADLAREAGDEVGGWRLAVGTRLWF